VQSSFSDVNTLLYRSVLLTSVNGYKRFLKDIEQIELLEKHPHFLINNKYFYGLTFKKDTVIDFDGKKFVRRMGKFESLEIEEKNPYFDDF